MSEKDQSAVSLGKRRWSNTTVEDRRAAMAKVQAKRRGKRTWTAEQRADAGKRLAAGRAAAKLRRSSTSD